MFNRLWSLMLGKILGFLEQSRISPSVLHFVDLNETNKSKCTAPVSIILSSLLKFEQFCCPIKAH